MENEKLEQEAENNEVEEVVEEPIDEPYPSQFLENIEIARGNFLRIYRIHNVLKWVVTIICFAAIIVAFVVAPNAFPDNSTLVMTIIAISALVLMVAYTLFAKRYIDKKMKEYFNLYYENVNHFALEYEGVENINSQFPGKILDEAFLDNNLYAGVQNVGSRGLTEFEYKGTPIAVCDCAAQVRNEQRRIVPVFVGKYLYAAANYDYDDPLYIYIKGDKRSLPPTNMSEVKAVSEDDAMVIYSNNSDWKKVLSLNVKKCLEKIKPNKDFVDCSISFQKGRMFVCMGYDDPLMVLPLQTKFNSKPNEDFKKDVIHVLNFIKEFNK